MIIFPHFLKTTVKIVENSLKCVENYDILQNEFHRISSFCNRLKCL